jgi:membrane-associated phospholipid phosphatase
VGVILSYICATQDRPLLDEAFTRADLALGFDWMRFYGFVQEHGNFRLMLTIAYYSGLPQIFFSIVFLAHIRRDDRNEELWWGCAIALILTSFLSGLFPAGGTLFYHQVGLDDAVHLPHFLALRDGHVTHFAFRELKGIVTFPSYHAVMAFLLVYAYRNLYGFRYVLALNIAMLVSTPINGGHYLVDLLGGAAVTVVSAFLAHRIRLLLSKQVQPSQRGRHVFGKSRNQKSVA